MILVVGATGLVGSEVCRKLAARGESVRALVRTTSAPDKVEELRSLGIDISVGDLKSPASLTSACSGVDSIISTASSTLSHQPGDSIETVDAAGQLNLVNAAKAAGIDRFLFVSFRPPQGISSPLIRAKQEVAKAISTMNYTVLQASYFMEVWLSPGLGFDYPNATARICGSGTGPVSWVSFADVAEMCAIALRHPAAQRRTIEFGGPDSLSLLHVVALFEKIGGRPFKLEYIPEQMLRAQYDGATDSLQKTFAALMLASVQGDAIDMAPTIQQFGLKLTSVEQYARRVLSATQKT
jgi:uncharacterized protein YbjT (DUF2867 family)